MHIELYSQQKKSLWDNFITHSKNGTFIHLRNYMDYHSHRFVDYSLMIYNDKAQLIALLPANKDQTSFYSHAGLTYGGLVTHRNINTVTVIAVFEAIMLFLKTQGFEHFFYKTIPAIYHVLPSDEDQYALFLCQAKLIRRDLLSVIHNSEKLSFQDRRRRMITKALKSGCIVKQCNEYEAYWQILQVALNKYGVLPVHSRAEIEFLAQHFPENIKLFGCYNQEKLLSGVVVYETNTAAHAQYIAVNEEGKKIGALDLIFHELIHEIYASKQYFDFGISNEKNGLILNQGLIEQKEGFGARGMIHDHYKVDLANFESRYLKDALQ